MTASPPLPWTAELATRGRENFFLKAVGTTVWIWVFFIGYFHVLRHPVHPITVMPLTWVDGLISFQPAGLVPYLSLWVYVGLAPGLQRGFWALFVYGLWAGGLCIAGLGIFYLWPTQIPSLAIDTTAPGFALLQGIDAAGNACPSMHVAFSAFSAIRIEDVLRGVRAPVWLRVLNLAWLLAITWSTLAIKQHVALDALAGALLGGAFAVASLHWRPQERWAWVGSQRAAIMK